MKLANRTKSESLTLGYGTRNIYCIGGELSRTRERHGVMPPKYRNRDTAQFANGEHVRRLQGVPRKRAYIALDRLDAATQLFDLKSPPGNRFEALRGDRQGQYSIRINDQWRVCFEWSDDQGEAVNIEITDYH